MSEPEFAPDDMQGWSNDPLIDHDDAPEPPNSIESEQALLGTLLVDNRSFDRVDHLIGQDSFFDPLHGRIYQTIKTQIERGLTVSPITINHMFADDDALKSIGGSRYLAGLAGAAKTIINVEAYAQTIRDLAILRGIWQASAEAIDAVQHFDYQRKPDDILADVEDRIEGLRRLMAGGAADSTEGVSLDQGIGEVFARVREIEQRGTKLVGIPTGLARLDARTGGLQKRHYNLLAGRPAMGKSALAISIGLAAARLGHGVLYPSYEMPGYEIAARALSHIASQNSGAPIPYSDILKGKVDFDHMQHLKAAREELQDIPFFIEDRLRRRVSDISAKLRIKRRALVQRGVDIELLIVDQISHLQAVGRHNGNRNSELTEISADLMALAKQSDVALLVLSQLSRQVEARDDKRPLLSDLRDSGSLEQDANLVMFAYREEYYLQRSIPTGAKHDEWVCKMADAQNRVEVITGKQRNGPTGKDDLFCDIKTNTIKDL